MKGIRILYMILVLAIVASGVAQAQSLNIWFGDSAGNPVTSVNVAPGANFGVSLWYETTSSWTHNAIEVLAGFDQSTSQGTGAFPISGEIGLVSVSNISFPIVLANNVGGGYGASGMRPYGAHLALGTALGTSTTATSPVLIANLTLKNLAIPTGSNYNMTVGSTGPGLSWTSYIPMGVNTLQDSSPVTLRVNSVTYTQYTISQFKGLTNGTQGQLTNAIVTVDVGDSFFVEASDRSTGIRVSKLGTEVYTPGELVTVGGAFGLTANGEKEMVSASVTTAAGSTIIAPLGIVNKSLGGSNVGLLVRVWGKPVLTGSTSSFQIQDGSGNVVAVQLPAGQTHGWTSGNLPNYVAVSGASGLAATGSAIYINNFSTDVQVIH